MHADTHQPVTLEFGPNAVRPDRCVEYPQHQKANKVSSNLDDLSH